MENKEFPSEKGLPNENDLSSEKELSNENLDLSDLEEVAGGKLAETEILKEGNGCSACFGMCGGSSSLEERSR